MPALFSPFAHINKGNVTLTYAVPLGGSAGDEWLEARPLKWLHRQSRAPQTLRRGSRSRSGRPTMTAPPLWRNLVISPAT
jgi:hypothetical protein